MDNNMEFQRESIFLSAFRTFSRVFFGVIALFLALALVMIGMQFLSSPLEPQDDTTIALLPDHKGNRTPVSLRAPAILRIDVTGVIGDPKGVNSTSFQTLLLASREGILAGDRVKGILLYVDTPGGAVTDSDDIYRMLLAYKKLYNVPIYTYINGLCASGGMYVTSASDKMYSSPVGVIGSVGVRIGPFFNVVGFMEKYGFAAKTLTQGLYKDFLNPTRPWKDGEDASLQNVMGAEYTRFIDVVTAGRPNLNRDQLISVYGAQIYDPNKAAELGYIDTPNVDETTALLDLLQAAQLNADDPYQYVRLDLKHSWLSDAFDSKFGTRHTLHLPGEDPAFLRGPAYYYRP